MYITRHGKINFVDLAGSEMTKKTKSEGKNKLEKFEIYHTPNERKNFDDLKKNIDKSLLNY